MTLRSLAYFAGVAEHDAAAITTEVMFTRLIGVALMNRPLTITVWSLCDGRLNSDTPISLNSFFPAGGVAGMSFGCGALAVLGTGSVAFTRVQLFGATSFRHPVTLTISTFGEGAACAASATAAANAIVFMARMIPPVTAGWHKTTIALRALLVAWLALVCDAPAGAHDLERTHVSITFARDGSFTLDVSNDPSWLKLRLEPFERQPGSVFSDRFVLFVDGHEIRPTSVELIPGDTLATYRMRGRMPTDAQTLRWYYGLVIDPYPLTIHRADGRLVVEEVAGDAWSRTIDLSGQFRAPLVSERVVQFLIAGLFLVPLALRFVFTGKGNHEDTKTRRKRKVFLLRVFVPSWPFVV